MADHVARHRASRAGWFGHGRTRALLSAGLLLGTGAVATSAYFTDKATVPGVSVTSGSLQIRLEPAQAKVIDPWSELNLANLQPGQSRSAIMTVTNKSVGRAPLSYRFQASAPGSTGSLGATLNVVVSLGGTVSANCSDGTPIGSGSLNGFDAPVGPHLQVNASHDLCVKVTLPAGATLAPNSTANVTFTFPAKQEQS